MNEARIKIIGYCADNDGLRLAVISYHGDEEDVGVVVVEHGQLETLLDAVALAMRFRKITAQS